MSNTKAYVLVETTVGWAEDVQRGLRKLKGVDMTDMVTGQYDLIITVSADDLNAVSEIVTDGIHKVGGIDRTVTCLVIDDRIPAG
tara:strand:- start:330 stop:584 length:255 start_codon:yes stop_codon:yes gene_type:complete